MRVIIVHTKDHVHTALETARMLHVPVMLQSAPDALFYAGGMYLLHMFEQAKTQFKEVTATFILDCTNAGGEAIAAMESGHTHIRSSASSEIRRKLKDIAAASGVKFVEESYESLDLHTVRDTKEACLKWLKREPCQ